MIDRLTELQSLIERPLPYHPPPVTTGPLQVYLKKIKSCQSSLLKVSKVVSHIKGLKKDLSRTSSMTEECAILTKLRDFIDFNNSELNKVRLISEDLSEELKHEEIDEVDNRLKVTMYATLMKQFQDSVCDSEKAQNEFNEYARDRVSKQLRMIDETIDDDFVDKCLEEPKLAQQVVEKELVGAHSEVISMVNRIEDRLEDIKALQKNIKVMHQMFLDLASLVDNQGEILNSIEQHVDNAHEYVIQGINAIENAEEQFKKARWKKCCFFIGVLLIAIIIAVPIITVKSI